MEKIHKAIPNTKGNILSLIYNRDYLLDLVDMYHGVTLRDAEENENLAKGFMSTHDSLESFRKALQESQMQNEQLDKNLQISLSPLSLNKSFNG